MPYNLRLKTYSLPLVTFSLSLICLTPFVSSSQNFSYKAKVDSVSKTGFYKIQLTPALASRAEASFSDLRLFDNDGKETPYLLKKEESFQQENNFQTYEIIHNQSEGNWQGIVVKNENKTLIDKLIFEMKNADAERSVRISGSNDDMKWFVVRDSFNFSAYGNQSTPTQYKMITFPGVDYEYYKIEIKNKDKNPLNILKVGYTDMVYQSGFCFHF